MLAGASSLYWVEGTLYVQSADTLAGLFPSHNSVICTSARKSIKSGGLVSNYFLTGSLIGHADSIP